MNCREIKKNLPEYLSGEQDEKTKKIISQHINQCELCRKELERYKELKILISQVKTPFNDEEFWLRYQDEVMEKINILPQRKEETIKGIFNFPVFIRRPAYAFAFVIFLIIGFLSYERWVSVEEQVAANNSLEFFIEEYDAVAVENIFSKGIPFEEENVIYKNDVN